MSEYPSHDSAIIEAAEEKWQRSNAAWLATQATIEKLQSDLQAANAARRKLVEDVADGATVKPEVLHDAAASVQKIEAELQHHTELLGIQEARRTEADKARTTAHGLAQAPILQHALRELRDVGVETVEVQRRAAQLSHRESEARKRIMDCFGAGLKIPSPLAPQPGSFWGGLPTSNAERVLRQSYGEYALAAFGPPADEAAVEGAK